jgi:uncharacterized protein (TIGR02118 family)
MIKLVFCVRRLPHFSRAEFQRYWLDTHGPLVRDLAPALGVKRYTQVHTVEEFARAGATPEGRAAGRRLLEDEKRFIDLARSPIWFGEEHTLVEPTK